MQRVTLSALALAMGAALAAVPAAAQDMTQNTGQDGIQTSGAQAMPAPVTPGPGMPAADEPKAPDGSKAFGIEPYLGIMGSYSSFDNDSDFGTAPGYGSLNSWMVTGIGGINIPLGPLFIGAEGNVAKGFSDIDWTYGVRGRFGLRAGETGMIFATGGYQWIEAKSDRGFPDGHGWVTGIGVEVGPRDIGMGGVTGTSGPRLRFQVETYKFQSIQPSVGVVFHF